MESNNQKQQDAQAQNLDNIDVSNIVQTPVSESNFQPAIKKHRGFQPGVSGNPKGRPPKDITIIDIIRSKLKEIDPEDKQRRTWAKVLADAELKAAKTDLQARKNLFDRLFGRATEQVNLNQSGEVILRVQYDDDAHNIPYVNSIEAKVTELPVNQPLSTPEPASTTGQVESKNPVDTTPTPPG